jgi:hypothetical protein
VKILLLLCGQSVEGQSCADDDNAVRDFAKNTRPIQGSTDVATCGDLMDTVPVFCTDKHGMYASLRNHCNVTCNRCGPTANLDPTCQNFDLTDDDDCTLRDKPLMRPDAWTVCTLFRPHGSPPPFLLLILIIILLLLSLSSPPPPYPPRSCSRLLTVCLYTFIYNFHLTLATSQTLHHCMNSHDANVSSTKLPRCHG